ncbi:DUF3800 domain-containing protein [Burkholderia gladioli]|uniref:DUF3800 domain-containing protein n=1 Tax=Burkholderia gladioli TaxID=28095 RepID=UPI001FC8E9B0|nr:DUF3800 domain-containing protein [Burkholderia gladioli]
MDDSGSRDPNRNRNAAALGPDWFALGGVLISSADVQTAELAIRDFRERWEEMGSNPLRSYDIRNKKNGFRWLAGVSDERCQQFLTELSELISGLPVHVLACVIDRPGYNKRYMELYGERRWKLCRTAFTIAVERAAKVAIHDGVRLRVFVERSDKPTEQQFKTYFDELRASGLPFDASASGKYRPLTQDQLHRSLFEFRVKTKDSLLMQMADLLLWPACCGGYNREHRAYTHLLDAGKLLDARCTDENGLLGIKYSCFEPIQDLETQKPA